MTRFSPFLPVVGPKTRFQPAYVDDVAKAAAMAAMGEVAPGVYELGGPDVKSFRELMAAMLVLIRRNRVIVSLPWFMARFMAGALDVLQAVTLRLFRNNQLTRDQVRQLRRDNVVSDGARGLQDLGITPTPMELVLPDYLWRFRPAGQYTAIRESADGLRGHE